MITLLKRTVALIIILSAFGLTDVGVRILIHANSFVDITKSILIVMLGGGGLYLAIEDFKNKKWPW